MRRNTGIWIGVLALAAPIGPARGADEAPVTEQDLGYRRVGATELKLDLARPAGGRGPFPAIVVIHGGGWRGGSKDSNRGLLVQWARQGYVAISPQYRFSPQETFPAQVHDVKAAVRWLRAHAEDYRVDPGRIGAMGFSAGGHLALMLGLTDPDDGLEGDAATDAPSSKVQAVVNFFGPTDLAAGDFPEATRPILRDFLGGDPAETRTAARRASPVSFATANDPPILSFQGTKDPLVPHSQAVTLADALTAAGVPGRVELLIGAGHGFQGTARNQAMVATLAFFNEHLKRPAP
ncbi:MAG TPA: alpha/beta hydrolase [Isosphaeraceae bacterium]|jgi:acetyl esterase/lipase